MLTFPRVKAAALVLGKHLSSLFGSSTRHSRSLAGEAFVKFADVTNREVTRSEEMALASVSEVCRRELPVISDHTSWKRMKSKNNLET